MSAVHERSGGGQGGSLLSYLAGLMLAVGLTGAAFWIVMGGGVSASAASRAVVAFAVAQILVHLFFFLHMNRSSEQRWNRMAFLFAILVVAILVGGSLWIMSHLNHNMMPMRME